MDTWFANNFSSACILLSYLLNRVFHRVKIFNFNEAKFINFFFTGSLFGVNLRILCLALSSKYSHLFIFFKNWSILSYILYKEWGLGKFLFHFICFFFLAYRCSISLIQFVEELPSLRWLAFATFLKITSYA